MSEIKYKVDDIVICTIWSPIRMVKVSDEPNFHSWQGIVLNVLPDNKYEIWGPGGSQSTKVGPECLKLVRRPENKNG